MKPYFKVCFNYIRLHIIKIRVSGLGFYPIQLLGGDCHLKLKKTSTLSLGNRVINDGRLVIIVGDRGKLTIGDHVYFNEDNMLSVQGKVIIGSGCKFGPGVKIFDNNHKYNSHNGVSNELKVGTVSIGSNCWIGSNCVLLKDTEIGDNCVIGAGCVVSGTIPSGSIVKRNGDTIIRHMRD